jgi:hypothetical protein
LLLPGASKLRNHPCYLAKHHCSRTDATTVDLRSSRLSSSSDTRLRFDEPAKPALGQNTSLPTSWNIFETSSGGFPHRITWRAAFDSSRCE